MLSNSDGGFAPKARSRSHSMDRKGAQVMFVCIFICMYVYMYVCICIHIMYICSHVFRGFLETESFYRTESGTIW